MRKLRNTMLALLIGCCSPALVWAGAGGALYHSRRRVKASESGPVCRFDTDCPPGYTCMNGRCLPDSAV